jgi:PE-PGRS family protein with aspartyl peptidase-like domain
MTGRDGIKGRNRRRMSIVGGAVGAFAAAAAMATGSAVTAAPAKADIDALLDPIIQPIITSLSDALVGFDPAAAADLTTWGDSLLSSLNALDVTAALPASAEPAGAVAASAPTGVFELPITMFQGTEPTVQATIDGAPNTLLIDTGSSGLVIPWESLGTNDLSALWNLFSLGLPVNFGESGYSGGVDYIYLTYDNIPVDYGHGLVTTAAPTDVEIFSWPTAAGAPGSFEQFLTDDSSTGILGIGNAGNAGPGTSPFDSAGFSGVTVDIPQHVLVVGANQGLNGLQLTPIETLTGAPTPINDLKEVVTSSTGATIGSGLISNDVDSGGVYGTIPSTIASSLAPGDKISVYDGTTLLYSYTIAQDGSNAPFVTTGGAGANAIDSGVEPFLREPIYISYAGTQGAITFDQPLS